MDRTPSPGTSVAVAGPAAYVAVSTTNTNGSTPPPALPAVANKILSQNANGTMIYTQRPRDDAELQLYRVMQRASLLAYYDTLLEMGGDDVQQLCEAGEEEFLEIMALVGMASKPLHVRRLQKALQEWLTNPAMFLTPLNASSSSSTSFLRSDPLSPPGNSLSPVPSVTSQSPTPIQQMTEIRTNTTSPSPSPRTTTPGLRGSSPPGSPLQLTPVLGPSQISRLVEAAQRLVRSLPHLEPKASTAKKKLCKDLELLLGMPEDDPRRFDQIRKYSAIYGRFDCKRKPEKPLTLHEVSVNEAAAQLCRLAPALLTRRDELFPLARQVVRDSGYHYSKGHSKSYAAINVGRMNSSQNGDSYGPTSKRARLDLSSSSSPLSNDSQDDIAIRLKRQERLTQVGEDLCRVTEQIETVLTNYRTDQQDLPMIQIQIDSLQTKKTQLLLEQNELLKQNHSINQRLYGSLIGNGNFIGSLSSNNMTGRRSNRISSCYDSEKLDTDDTDSQFSFSNASSPYHEIGDSRDSMRELDNTDPLRSPPKNNIKQDLSIYPENHQDDNDSKQKENSSAQNCKEIVITKTEQDDENSFHDNDDDEDEESFYHENKVKVIASSGGNIIAVANPALSMSPAIVDATVILKKEQPLIITSSNE